MQHMWTIPCRVAIIDRTTNNVSLIDIVEEVTVAHPDAEPAAGVPGVPMLFDIMTLWRRENPDQPETGFSKMSLLSPQGAVLVEAETDVDLRTFKRCRATTKLVGIPVAGPGTYQFRVERRADSSMPWEEVGRVPLDVTVDPALNESTANGAANRRD